MFLDEALLSAEYSNMNDNKEALERVDATIQFVGRCRPSMGWYSTIWSSPVGKPMGPLKEHVAAALASLKRLHKEGLIHGDSRWENAVIVSGTETIRKYLQRGPADSPCSELLDGAQQQPGRLEQQQQQQQGTYFKLEFHLRFQHMADRDRRTPL